MEQTLLIEHSPAYLSLSERAEREDLNPRPRKVLVFKRH